LKSKNIILRDKIIEDKNERIKILIADNSKLNKIDETDDYEIVNLQ